MDKRAIVDSNACVTPKRRKRYEKAKRKLFQGVHKKQDNPLAVFDFLLGIYWMDDRKGFWRVAGPHKEGPFIVAYNTWTKKFDLFYKLRSKEIESVIDVREHESSIPF